MKKKDDFTKRMKHRKKNSKIKYEHHMIEGLRELLEELEKVQEIKSIIPARINQKKGTSRGTSLKIQYPTKTGLKCLAISRNSVQEVFIVTDKPEETRRILEKNENYKL